MNLLDIKQEPPQYLTPDAAPEIPPAFEIKRKVFFEAIDTNTGEPVLLPPQVVIRKRTTWHILKGTSFFCKASTRKKAFEIAENAFADSLEGSFHG